MLLCGSVQHKGGLHRLTLSHMCLHNWVYLECREVYEKFCHMDMCATHCWDMAHNPLCGKPAGNDGGHSCVACCIPKHMQYIRGWNGKYIHLHIFIYICITFLLYSEENCTLLQCHTGWAHSCSWVLVPHEQGCRLFLGQGEQSPEWQGSWHECWPQLKVRPQGWPHDQALAEHRRVFGGCCPQWQELLTFLGQGGQGPEIRRYTTYSTCYSIFSDKFLSVYISNTRTSLKRMTQTEVSPIFLVLALPLKPLNPLSVNSLLQYLLF